MSDTQSEVAGPTKRPMVVKQVSESGPCAWAAMKLMSDGFVYAAPGATERDAVENLVTFLIETLERYENALCEVAAGNDSGPTCAVYASDALGIHFKNGERVLYGEAE